jgi:hypothetical protein
MTASLQALALYRELLRTTRRLPRCAPPAAPPPPRQTAALRSPPKPPPPPPPPPSPTQRGARLLRPLHPPDLCELFGRGRARAAAAAGGARAGGRRVGRRQGAAAGRGGGCGGSAAPIPWARQRRQRARVAAIGGAALSPCPPAAAATDLPPPVLQAAAGAGPGPRRPPLAPARDSPRRCRDGARQRRAAVGCVRPRGDGRVDGLLQRPHHCQQKGLFGGLPLPHASHRHRPDRERVRGDGHGLGLGPPRPHAAAARVATADGRAAVGVDVPHHVAGQRGVPPPQRGVHPGAVKRWSNGGG